MGIFKQRGVNALSADQTSQVIISDVRNYVRNSPAIEHIWGQQMSKITARRHNIGPNNSVGVHSHGYSHVPSTHDWFTRARFLGDSAAISSPKDVVIFTRFRPDTAKNDSMGLSVGGLSPRSGSIGTKECVAAPFNHSATALSLVWQAATSLLVKFNQSVGADRSVLSLFSDACVGKRH